MMEEYKTINYWHQKLKISEELKTIEQYQKMRDKAPILHYKPMQTKRDQLNLRIMRIKFGEERTQQYFLMFQTQKHIEMKIGLLIELYIESKLKNEGWFRSHILRFCDFVHKKYPPVQIKNRNNTENSSSKYPRKTKMIKFWFRLNSRTGETKWGDLKKIFHTKQNFSEEEFQNFCLSALEIDF